MRAIDLLVEAAKSLRADQKSVALMNIRKKAMKLDKQNSFNSEDGLDAELSYHTVNMRSRFINSIDRDKNSFPAWKSEPFFYRVDRGIYKLLTEDEKKLFKTAIYYHAMGP